MAMVITPTSNLSESPKMATRKFVAYIFTMAKSVAISFYKTLSDFLSPFSNSTLSP